MLAAYLAHVDLTGFYANGKDLVVAYDVVGSDAQPFEVNVYRSEDGVTPGERVACREVTANAERRQGEGHTVTVQADFDDVLDDYRLIAIVALRSKRSAAFVGPEPLADSIAFQGGVFVAGDGTVQVHGSDEDDRVLLSLSDTGTLHVSLNDRWGGSYDSREVAAIHVRTHGGDDKVETSPRVAVPLVVFAGEGDDVVRGGSGDDLLVGGPGHDRLFGSKGNDVLVGGDGNDSLWGGDGDDVLHGGSGYNTLIAGAGDDRVFQGKGQDHLDRDAATAVFGSLEEDALQQALMVAAGQPLPGGLSASPAGATGDWTAQSLGSSGGFGLAADHVAGGSVVKRELPVSGGSFDLSVFQPGAGAGVAVDHTAGGPFLKRDGAGEEPSLLPRAKSQRAIGSPDVAGGRAVAEIGRASCRERV